MAASVLSAEEEQKSKVRSSLEPLDHWTVVSVSSMCGVCVPIFTGCASCPCHRGAQEGRVPGVSCTGPGEVEVSQLVVRLRRD